MQLPSLKTAIPLLLKASFEELEIRWSSLKKKNIFRKIGTSNTLMLNHFSLLRTTI